MRGRNGLWPLWAALLIVGWISAVGTAAPWDKLLTLNRVEADPNRSYALSEENGPWMISACSFSGEQADRQAKELALELRKRYKLEAYTHHKVFDLDRGEEVYGRGIDRFGNPLKMKYQSERGSKFGEVAVLVGNYPAVDDARAQETLRKLKYSKPECLVVDDGRTTARSLAGWRTMQKWVLAPGSEKKERGPMGHAMITTNPLLEQGFFTSKGLDPLVLKANKGVENCLLDCPKKFTVQVATFRGRMIIDQRKIADIDRGRESLDGDLVEATEKAHNLTNALRLKGYEAYEFHDRYASIVTVGSFDWVTRNGLNGRPETNPKVQAIIDRFKAKQTLRAGNTGGMAQQMLLGIPFDMAPKAVHVPKRSIGDHFNRDLTRLF